MSKLPLQSTKNSESAGLCQCQSRIIQNTHCLTGQFFVLEFNRILIQQGRFDLGQSSGQTSNLQEVLQIGSNLPCKLRSTLDCKKSVHPWHKMIRLLKTYKTTIVGDNNRSVGIILKISLQPNYSFQIQVICWLVKHENVRLNLEEWKVPNEEKDPKLFMHTFVTHQQRSS